MGLHDVLGPSLLAGGPLIVALLALLATRPLLVLVAWASAFYWLTALLFSGALLKPFSPLSGAPLAVAAALTALVLVQDASRWVLVRGLEALCRGLRGYARRASQARPSHPVLFGRRQELAVALAAGLAHAAVHAVFFSIAWVPLGFDAGTLYLRRCSAASYFTLNAANAAAFSLVLPAADTLAFLAGSWTPLPVGLHAGAAALTLLNLAPEGCVLEMPLIAVYGLGCAALALRRSLADTRRVAG